MAHYQWVYGKITQPSDKLFVIDSELETYAPVEADADSSRFHCFSFSFSKMAHREKIWAHWNNHTSLCHSRLSENLAAHLRIIQFTTAFVLCFFKSPVACQLLCGILELFSFIYTRRNCVLRFQKGLPQCKLYCSLSITDRWLREPPSCFLKCTSACECLSAHHVLWLTRRCHLLASFVL